MLLRACWSVTTIGMIGCLTAPTDVAAAGEPNVVLIYADDK
jgi:hypothetical protein